MHSFLQRDYQNLEDESKLLLKRLQALNTMSRTNSIPPNPNISELDTDGLKRLQIKSRSILERCCNLLERIEVSNLEHALSERQLLRSAVYQRNLFAGNGRDFKHDSPLYGFTPNACFFPSSKALEHYWPARRPSFQHGSWLCFRSIHSELAESGAKSKKKKSKNAEVGYTVYRNLDRTYCQAGEPFDLNFKSRTSNLKREEWSEYIVNAMVNQSTLEHLGIELLQDEYGGYLYYCPNRKSYSSTGNFDQPSFAASNQGSQSHSANYRDGSHHIWNQKFAAKKVNRIMSSSSRRGLGGNLNGNVWEKFPSLGENFADEIDTSTFFLTSEHTTNLSNSKVSSSSDLFYRSLNLLPASNPKHQIHRSFDIFRSAFEELTKSSQVFSLSQFTSDGLGLVEQKRAHEIFDQHEKQNEDESNLDHWNILHNAFGIANDDLNLINEKKASSRNSSGFDHHHEEENLFNPMAEYAKIFRMLKYEEQMDLDSYRRYDTLIVGISQADAENPIPLLELVEFLILQGLGKPALAVLKQAIDVMLVSPIYGELQKTPQPFEFALGRILSMKMSEKYFNYYEKYDSVMELLHLYSSGFGAAATSFVLTSMSSYFLHLQQYDWSESLLIAALLTNSNDELTLLRYAELLARKGDFRGALKYLHRISTSVNSNANSDNKKGNSHHSQTIARIALLEESWILDLFQSEPQNHEAIILGYKSVFQTHYGDKIQSLALHSLSAFCLAQGFTRNQIAEFLQRSIQCDSDNALAFFLYASISTVFQISKAVSGIRQKESLHAQNASPALNNSQPNTNKKKDGISKSNKKASVESSGQSNNSNVTPTGEGIQLSDDNPVNFYSLEQIDSSMRRGLVLMGDVKYRWIPLLSYADFIHFALKDVKRAKEYYEQSMKISFSTEISPIVAFTHFNQYSLNDYQTCNSLLLRAMRSRHGNATITSLKLFNNFHKPLRSEVTSTLEAMNEEEKMIFDMGPPSSPVKNQRGMSSSSGFRYRDDDEEEEEYRQSLIPCQDRLDCISLYVVVAYYLWDIGVGTNDQDSISAAKQYAMASLKLQRNYSPALRLIGLISFFEGDSSNNKRLGAKYVAAACHSALSSSSSTTTGNPLYTSGEEAFEVPLEKSKCILQKSLLNTVSLKTNAMMKAYWNHYDQAITLLERSLTICPTCQITHRSLAMLYYLYKDNATKALTHLTMAYDLSQQEDIEVLRWKAQILMDQKEYDEARILLQDVIQKVPYDAISFVSLAWCMYYINKSTSLGLGGNTTTVDNPFGVSLPYQGSSASDFYGFHGSHVQPPLDEKHFVDMEDGDDIDDLYNFGKNTLNRNKTYIFHRDNLNPIRLEKLSSSKDCLELLHVGRALITILTEGGKREYADGLSDASFEKLPDHKKANNLTEQLFSSSPKKEDVLSSMRTIKKCPFDQFITGYTVSSFIHYWTGLYHLQESKNLLQRQMRGQSIPPNSIDLSLQSAISMFSIASSVHHNAEQWGENEESISSSTHSSNNRQASPKKSKKQQEKKFRLHNAMYACLSKYFIGSIHEQKENLNAAEQYYEEALSIAVSCVNLNPIVLLRLIRHMEKSLIDSKELLQRLNRREQGLKKLKKKKKSTPASSKKIISSKPAATTGSTDEPAMGSSDFPLGLDSELAPLQSASIRRGIAEMNNFHSYQSSSTTILHEANAGYPGARPSSASSGSFFTPKRNTWQDLNHHQEIGKHSSINAPNERIDKAYSSVLNLHSTSQLADEDPVRVSVDSYAQQVLNPSYAGNGDEKNDNMDPYDNEDDGEMINFSELQQSLDGRGSAKAKQMSPEMVLLIKRVLMHQRILEAALVKKFSSDKVLKDISKVDIRKKSFIFVEADWIEKTLYAFGKCEDWSQLLLSMNDCYI